MSHSSGTGAIGREVQDLGAPLIAAAGARVVDELVVHGAPLNFRELARRAIPEHTDYVVLDLDRTTHLARNMGELLGWELGAYLSYGASYLQSIESRRAPGRFCVSANRLIASARYLAEGALVWGGPGLRYLWWGKIASRVPAVQRETYRRFGPEAVRAVQEIAQVVLMEQLARLPLDTLRELARKVWNRHADDAVITREDIAWLRRRCPRVKVIVSSASPEPMLDAARAALDLDDAIYSTAEVRDGYLGAPFQSAMRRGRASVHHLSRPSQQTINAGSQKLLALARRYPALLDPRTVSVGISDTAYGEDHVWTRMFSTVIDINSPAPFSPVVPSEARVRSIHSALVLTQHEQRTRGVLRDDYLDPRRGNVVLEQARARQRAELERELADVCSEVGHLSQRWRERAREGAAS